eukprot:10642971-Alexandrium_andersonii.AAC.1
MERGLVCYNALQQGKLTWQPVPAPSAEMPLGNAPRLRLHTCGQSMHDDLLRRRGHGRPSETQG